MFQEKVRSGQGPQGRRMTPVRMAWGGGRYKLGLWQRVGARGGARAGQRAEPMASGRSWTHSPAGCTRILAYHAPLHVLGSVATWRFWGHHQTLPGRLNELETSYEQSVGWAGFAVP